MEHYFEFASDGDADGGFRSRLLYLPRRLICCVLFVGLAPSHGTSVQLREKSFQGAHQHPCVCQMWPFVVFSLPPLAFTSWSAISPRIYCRCLTQFLILDDPLHQEDRKKPTVNTKTYSVLINLFFFFFFLEAVQQMEAECFEDLDGTAPRNIFKNAARVCVNCRPWGNVLLSFLHGRRTSEQGVS